MSLKINTKLFQPSIWDDFPMKRNNQFVDTIIQPDFELDIPERIKLPKGFQIIELPLHTHIDRIREFLNANYTSIFATNSPTNSPTNSSTNSPTNSKTLQYSNDYLEWLFMCPKKHFKKIKNNDHWLVGVEDISSGDLLGFISARPIQYYIDGRYTNALLVDKMCVKENARTKRLSIVLMKEIYRRMKSIENEYMALFCTSCDLPFQPLTNRSYMLVKNLTNNSSNNINNDNDLISQRDQETDTTRIKELNELIAQTQEIVPTQDIHQIRLANKRDIDDLMKIYTKYYDNNNKQRYYRSYNKKEFEHVFLPRKDMIYTYVLTNSQGELKDFVSFHIFYTNEGTKIAYLYYISYINDKLLEIFMKNILYVLKESEVDQVISHEWMGVSHVFVDILNFHRTNTSYAWYAFNYNTKNITNDECAMNTML